MKVTKLDECPDKNNALLKVTEMGNVIELQYMSKRNTKQTVQMLQGMKQYVDLTTGEIKDVVKHDTRADLKKNLYRTFKALRGIINANITDVTRVRWITLTYAENMQDTKQLYDDFVKFNKRFQYYCKSHSYSKAEYIVMVEPQQRGAWHFHLLYMWDTKAPYISNQDLSDIWGHGFVKISKLDDVDNVGAYLTAYLGDMNIESCSSDEIADNDIKVLDIIENGVITSKSYVKGARLKYYPSKFNMYRCSRGIKRPTTSYLGEEQALKKVSASTLTFEKTIRLEDTDNNFESIINTRYYNKARKASQASKD